MILRHIAEMASKRYVSFGDYSVTDVIAPYRIVRLKKRHAGQLKPKLSSQIASIIGTGIHEFFENMLKLYSVLDPKYMLERSVMDVIKIGNQKRLITGRFDVLYDLKHMYDIKSTNVWKKIFDPDMIDWHQQQNLYAYLLHKRGIDVETLNIVAVYKDWKEMNAIRDKNYPQDQVVEYQLNKWPYEVTEELLVDRLQTHVACENLEDYALPVCTPDERWESSMAWAILKNRKAGRATKVVTTSLVDALAAARSIKGLGADSVIEVRHGQRKRCEKYCDVAPFCDEYANYCERKQNSTLNDYISLKEVL